MKANVNLKDLSLSNFDQIMEVGEIKGGKRRPKNTTYSVPTFSFPSINFNSVTTWKKKRRR